MRYLSTRGGAPAVPFSEAVEAGLAPDGGLYVPEALPPTAFDGVPDADLAAVGARLLAPFLEGDRLAGKARALCRTAWPFSAPLSFLDGETAVLELFHGPTAAFKDFGAAFLAACARELPADPPRTVLVATSGDTGGAVAGAFHGASGIEVAVLFPKGRVSARQEKQLTAWGGNVRAFAVRGTFDDCQRVVKEAFSDAGWRRRRRLIAANSISVARLLPQAAYYARGALQYVRERGVAPGFVVPSGNLGNAVAALYAKRIGLPIGRVVLAANANRPVPEYVRTGVWKPLPTVATLANAMDVGNASNMDRLRHLYPSVEALRSDVDAVSVSDQEIGRTIEEQRWGRIWCPHTAAGVFARGGRKGHWIVVATAHPAKFDEIVEPRVGRKVEVPEALERILERPSSSVEIDPTLEALARALGG
jgi:threonine synthase